MMANIPIHTTEYLNAYISHAYACDEEGRVRGRLIDKIDTLNDGFEDVEDFLRRVQHDDVKNINVKRAV